MFFSQYFNTLYISGNLIIAVYFICAYLFKGFRYNKLSISLKNQITFGVIGGFLSIFLMLYSFNIADTTTLLDFRLISILISFYICGLLSATINSVFTILFRLFYFGVTYSAMLGSLGIIAVLLFLCVMTLFMKNKSYNHTIRWFLPASFCLLTNILVYLAALNALVINPWGIITAYSFWFVIATILVFYLLNYLIDSNALFHNYLENSSIDYLTGLYNTRHFDTLFNKMSEDCQKNQTPMTCVMLDIDLFKKINDTYGHTCGDIAIQEIANRLKESFCSSDIVARIGGEEFCILIKNCNRECGFQKANAFRTYIENHPIKLNDSTSIRITISMGIANYPESTHTLSDIKRIADMALYNAKNSGRNKVCIL